MESFGWIDVWLNNHFILILKKLSPFILVLLILSVILFLQKRKKTREKNNRINQVILINIIFLIIWFFLFPTFRFGLGIIGSLISLILVYLFSTKIVINENILQKSILFFVIFFSLSILIKNAQRIYKKLPEKYVDYPWPKKNSHYPSNIKLKNLAIKNNNQILYYITPNDELCFYSKSPCSHKRNLKIKKENILKYYKKYKIDK